MTTAAGELQKLENELIRSATVRLRSRVMAIVFGLVGGTGLFLATAWLLAQGGQAVGKHLNLLGNFFPGYAVTWPGAFLGFFYGLIAGGLIGWAVAFVYNQLVDRRETSA